MAGQSAATGEEVEFLSTAIGAAGATGEEVEFASTQISAGSAIGEEVEFLSTQISAGSAIGMMIEVMFSEGIEQLQGIEIGKFLGRQGASLRKGPGQIA